MMNLVRLIPLICTALWVGPALAAPPLVHEGDKLRDPGRDRALYTFDIENPAQPESRCHDACAAVWPPFLAEASDRPHGDLGVVTRKDGTRQWTLKGKPLYRFAGDAAAVDERGHGVDGTWRLARLKDKPVHKQAPAGGQDSY